MLYIVYSLLNRFCRQGWMIAQKESVAYKWAISHLSSGKVPTNKPSDLFKEMILYICHCSLATDNFLITHGNISAYSPRDPKNKMVVPHSIPAGLLFHLYNTSHKHYWKKFTIKCSTGIYNLSWRSFTNTDTSFSSNISSLVLSHTMSHSQRPIIHTGSFTQLSSYRISSS